MAGQVVRGDKYFPREKDQNKLLRRLRDGSHLLVLAPRRVGKTSMLFYLQDNPPDGYVFLYNIVQSCATEHEYYKQIIDNLFHSEFTDQLSSLFKWGKDQIDKFRSSITGVSVGATGIKFDQQDRQLTHRDLSAALNALTLDKKLVLIIDEFPDVVEKIYDQQDHKSAESFLSGCRELWSEQRLNQHVQFVLTGSIGLDTLVSKMALSDLINVLIPVSIAPLSQAQGREFINTLNHREQEPIQIDATAQDYLLDKVGWLMPYYIEILWMQLVDVYFDEGLDSVSPANIDAAYNTLFSIQYQSHFNHWAERLNRFADSEKALASDVLTAMCEHAQLPGSHLFNLSQASRYQQINCQYVIDCLIHDGYIFINQAQCYQFTSPMLKEWWGRYATRRL
ncbi:ATP-binding protein [Pseudoalteromonas rubra]|uniref:ATP-binding protein n=1 Tax=Pseudoalteromonas rubra TaxID=43658 RepID=A0A5S3WNR3_9GAMM|nr:ATP-binding protein [Pseudoalteromonas rubra]TMP29317.1 ATP-binding protein [Pseudoalteromonas rubra]TMP34078.1 ATP-binding protein [Pseudoalteromonas rubra]